MERSNDFLGTEHVGRLMGRYAVPCFIFLQAVGKALASTMLSMFREVVFGVGFALLLPVFLGLDGVLWSMPVSDVLTFVISAVIIVKTYRDLDAPALRAR